ncbi:hypothetical protein HELRODRAFT_70006, partial [Helobdella robusta]|uniref:Ras-related protein Rab-36 n=1 Tax=Helobdella robusta TaxID=6412 RepID=T1G014_HELRO
QIVKAVVVGDQAVGKSSLLQRFCYNTFKSDYKCTIGVDFEIEQFQILNKLLKVQFWDTAGQERFKCIAASYYRGSKAVIVVFDMSSIQSLMNAKQWASEAYNEGHEPSSSNGDARRSEGPLLFLVGTKRDLVVNNTWKEVEALAVTVAKEIRAELWIVSSLTGCERVNDFFFRLAAMLLENSMKNALLVKQVIHSEFATDMISQIRKFSNLFIFLYDSQ